MKKNQLPSPQTGNDLPAVELSRTARVKTIKQAVESGTYKIDDRSLADSLISDLLREEWARKRLSKP
jgi:anti-sigma28 factor (negative regulator of flagellin synthesis)